MRYTEEQLIYEKRKDSLIRYLSRYQKKYGKTLIMKNVVNDIYRRLFQNQPITIYQFTPVAKFLVRESEFDNNNKYLWQYYEPLFSPAPYPTESEHSSDKPTLDQFFV